MRKIPFYRDRTHVPTCQKVTRLPLSYWGDRHNRVRSTVQYSSFDTKKASWILLHPYVRPPLHFSRQNRLHRRNQRKKSKTSGYLLHIFANPRRRKSAILTVSPTQETENRVKCQTSRLRCTLSQASLKVLLYPKSITICYRYLVLFIAGDIRQNNGDIFLKCYVYSSFQLFLGKRSVFSSFSFFTQTYRV